ncbi:MAG: response regulator [Desulfobulbaceae bacterium]|nr:response regulator [Desulfobulbaceae bacterium]
MTVRRQGRSKILLADDDQLTRSTLAKILEVFGHKAVVVGDGQSALETVDDSFDLIILDINMPRMDGYETISALNDLHLDIPVLFLTGGGSMQQVMKAMNLGAYDFLTKPIEDLDVFNIKIRRAIEKRMYILQERDYRESLEDDIRLKARQLEEKNTLLLAYSDSLENATVQIMTSLQNAMERKDYYTAGHTLRVTEYAMMTGRAMGLPQEDMLALRRAAQFHDIGKLVIDLSCIRKDGSLTEEEWRLVREHPTVGAAIIEPLSFMMREQFIIRHHHERMDGQGYPDGLKGDDLDILTRILIVTDSFDAMTSQRNYRRNMNVDEAVEELFLCADSQFDRDVVEVFAKSIVDFTLKTSVFSGFGQALEPTLP